VSECGWLYAPPVYGDVLLLLLLLGFGETDVGVQFEPNDVLKL
jgi:hypothetical protein